MSDVIRIALVQTAADLDPAVNRARLAGTDTGDADLVVWPEAAARDFGAPGSDVAPYAESPDGPFATALEAAAGSAVAVAGMFETGPDPERPFNTLLVRGAGGSVRASYRKVHLYDSFGYRESDRLAAGPLEPCVVDVHGWRVGLMTCYDLRFPEWARLLVDAGAELLVVPAAWVAGPRKVDHWRTLLRARAIENTVWVAACGQPAPRYTGHSVVVDPWGEVRAEAGDGEQVLHATITRDVLDDARATNPSLRNRRLGPAASR
ncbi:carbon-nitrogen hydrolase family protein [Nocardioides sp.]|uniref:carbon-nitrogen hydrolase family protein n=1 Tax=Nocardioides sp. TaxID=35761 RepID=UPI003513F070